jgi:hypothetical protein
MLISEAIVFISRNKIKEGKIDEFRKHYRDSLLPTFIGKPDTLAQFGYENKEATEFTVVRVFPNANALDLQLQGADERSKKTYEFIEPIVIEIFGLPNPSTLLKMMEITGSVSVTLSPNYIGGFVREVK